MTDKQIIIDGCDVSGCDFLAKEDDYCSYSGVTYAYKGQCMCSDEEMCKEHPKCFYKKVHKQLKRKEQECEELKKQLETKGKILTLIDEAKNEYSKENNKLKQTLAEIKEIAEVLITMTDEYDNCYYKERCSKCEVKDDCQYIKVEQILQKISEVEDEK